MEQLMMNLFDLAKHIQTTAERFARSRNDAGLASHLRARLQQITGITDRAKTLETRQRLVAQVEPGVRVPKTQANSAHQECRTPGGQYCERRRENNRARCT